MKLKFEWEDIFYQDDRHYTVRARVIGGWMVVHYISSSKGITSSGIFVPDKEGEWEIDYD